MNNPFSRKQKLNREEQERQRVDRMLLVVSEKILEHDKELALLSKGFMLLNSDLGILQASPERTVIKTIV